MTQRFEEGQFSDADEEDQVTGILHTFKGKCKSDMDLYLEVKKKVAELHVKDNKGNNIENNNGAKNDNDNNDNDNNDDDNNDDDDDDDDDYCNSDYDLYENNTETNTVTKPNLQGSNTQNISIKVTNYQPKHKSLTRYSNKINLEEYEVPSLKNHVANALAEHNRRVDKDRIRMKDKSDHATTENVLDSRIKMQLHKLFEKGMLIEINGCISTGKEANVYYAKSHEDEIAIKIYRTSVLQFKNRERYIKGEYRFDHVHSLRNPRKMVKIWAEKEFYNLKRLEQGGVRAPRPILRREHMLLMEFLGSDGWPAPKLKDAVLTDSKSRTLYRECIEIMWKMYNKCRLVHADLSEYNMLYHNGSIIIIDVSQTVDHQHCNAIDFLKKDCSNITAFFENRNVDVMSLQALFDFITDPTVNENNMDEYLDMCMQKTNQKNDPEQQINEAVFKQAYIPQRLNQVKNVQLSINNSKSGKQDLIHRTLLGLKAESDICTSSEGSENSDSETENGDNTPSKFVNSARPRNESPESKKVRKKAVKEQQAEKRKVKMKKHVKKRKIKNTTRGGK